MNELTRALQRIALLRTLDDVVGETLRTATSTLGYERAVFYVDECGEPRARRAFERGEERDPSTAAPSPASASCFRAARSGIEVAGEATDLWAPLVDVRTRYVLAPLLQGDERYGFLYADGPQGADESHSIAGLCAIAAIASRNALMFAGSEELASRDPLTGLLNRRALAQRLAQQLEAARRNGFALVYLLIDVDDFKRINDDGGGHAAGDAHLRRLAAALAAMSRGEDVVARYAGDEFVMVMTSRDPSLVRGCVARIGEELKAQSLHCSGGAAVYPRDGLDASTLSWAADRALYAAKRAGKGAFVFA